MNLRGQTGNGRLLVLLGLLYFAQGLPSGLLAKALPPLLREQGASLSAIGLTGLLAAPWALKFLWSPLVERTGTRRHWLLVLNAITLALMLALAARDLAAWVGDGIAVFMVLLLLLNLMAATQDIVTDGFAVNRLPRELRGLGNSLQVIGYKTGMTLGSAALLGLVGHWGWSLAYGALAMLLVPVLIAVWWLTIPARAAAYTASHPQWRGIGGYLHLMRDFAVRPGLGWWLVTVATFKIGDSLGSRMIGPLLSDRGMTLAEMGALTGLASLVGLVGALLGGLVLLRLGHRNALLLFGSMQALGLAGYLPLAEGLQAPLPVAAVVCFEQFADGLATVALFTMMMDACRASSPGVDYTLQASLLVIVTGLVALGSGVVADALGYGAVFGGGAALTLLALIPAFWWARIAGRITTEPGRQTPRKTHIA